MFMAHSEPHKLGQKAWLLLLLSMAFTMGGATATSIDSVGEEESVKTGALQAAAAPSPIIRSRAELDAYLSETGSRKTPLDRLTPGAQGRFLRSLEFGDKGLRNFKIDDLSAELTREEIRDILALFDMGRIAESITPADATRPASRNPDIASRFTSAFERRFDQFHGATDLRPDETTLQAAARLGAAFDTLFPEVADRAALQRLDDHDLRLAYRAAVTANLPVALPQRIATMQAVFDELQARDMASQQNHLQLHRVLVSARMFDEARRFADAHQDAHLPSLPALNDAGDLPTGHPTVWRMDEGGKSWSRSAIDLDPVQIIVTSGCHFAEDAARAISSDPLLGPVFQHHARWLSLPPGSESFDDVRNWNLQYPNASMDMVHDRAEWPMFERWIMPTFYIFKNGKIVDSVSGWPPQPTREHLIAALARAGLLPAGTPSSGGLSSGVGRDKPE